jgi:hypothetical protein
MSRVNVYVYAKVFGSSEAPIGEIIAENGVGEECWQQLKWLWATIPHTCLCILYRPASHHGDSAYGWINGLRHVGD